MNSTMDLKLYDTLTREKRVFTPLDPANVRMYVCGPTVYDFAHIGNARPVIVFDVLFRLLRHRYGADHVTYVRNITDVDDKINARAAEEYPALPLNEAIRKVTEQTDKQFHEDVAALGCLPPTVEPRATEHIAEMRAMIERLIKSGNAYVAEDNVLFSVPSMPDYGMLSKRPLDEMIAGARVEVAPYKREPMDFVLWKPSKPGNNTPLWFWAEDWTFLPSEPFKLADAERTALWFWANDMVFVLWDPSTSREPAWLSPSRMATPGRPGWHIECSAMSWKYLGEIFDIHGGGIDLVFPHHENEIAQSRCTFHKPVMANYWMHNGFLQVEGEKMSKSLGNFVTIHELLQTEKLGGRSWPGEVMRLAMLGTHYTQPIDWTASALEEASVNLTQWKKLIARVDPRKLEIKPDSDVLSCLLDDLNTPEMLVRLHQIAKEAQKNEQMKDVLYDNLVFLGFVPNEFVVADKVVEELRAETKVSRPGSGEMLIVESPEVERFMEGAFVNLPPASNSTSTIITASQIFSGTVPSYKFLDDWTKYNPFYISPRDQEFVTKSIGIRKLNSLIEERLKSRNDKQFAESDGIRDELAKMGVVLKDTKDGTTWEIAR
jgi:cysteinyl-tRNA synthetase